MKTKVSISMFCVKIPQKDERQIQKEYTALKETIFIQFNTEIT